MVATVAVSMKIFPFDLLEETATTLTIASEGHVYLPPDLQASVSEDLNVKADHVLAVTEFQVIKVTNVDAFTADWWDPRNGVVN